MLRSGRVLLAGVVVAMACAVALGAAAGKPVGTFNGCPAGLEPVPTTYKSTARDAATVFLRTTYARWDRERHWGIKLAGAQVGRPFLVQHWLPSGWIKSECGTSVWRRSVGVSVSFPAMEYPNPKGPCNACSHVTLLLGKTQHGWATWGNY
jgi:hypothetical protein